MKQEVVILQENYSKEIFLQDLVNPACYIFLARYISAKFVASCKKSFIFSARLVIINSYTMGMSGNSLISVTNGVIYFIYPFKCTNNSYYRNVIELHSSIAVCKGLIILTGNNVRQILQVKSGSYTVGLPDIYTRNPRVYISCR